MGILQHGIIYTTWDLAIEASYVIHKNDYWHDELKYSLIGKHIVANYKIICHTFSYLVFCKYSNAK